MNLIFKRLGAWATNSRTDNFKAAVLRLTVLYTTGVFILLLVFSFLVYGLFSAGVTETLNKERGRAEDLVSGEDKESMESLAGEQEPVFEEITENLMDILLFSDAVLLLITVIASYVLARKTLAPLEDAYQKQKRFIADAAHELRTPLAVMKAGGGVLLQHERTPEQYKKFIEEALEEVDRLIALSNDLLFLAQRTELQKKIHGRVSLSDICKRQSDSVRAYAGSRNITVDSKIDPEVFIVGREEDLSRLVLNFLKNAVDHNKPSGKVTLSLTKKNRQAVLVIEDTGVGIAKEDIAHIFERFFKADTSRTQKNTSGSGLGLSIVKEIAAQHGGTIRVHSTPGVGTSFEVYFQSA